MKLITIKVIPNSSRNKISEKFFDEKNQECWKINLTAVAEDGKANAALIKFLAKEFKISKSKIEIIRGETSRNKMIRIFEN